MRFVFLSLGYHPDHFGGASRYVAAVAERLASRGHAVEAIFPDSNRAADFGETRNGVRLLRLPGAGGAAGWLRRNAAARSILLGRLRGVPSLLVQCHGYFTPAAAAHAPRAFFFTGPWAEEFRFTARAPGSPAGRSWLAAALAAGLRQLERRALHGADGLLTLSEYYRAQLPCWHGAGLPRPEVIGGGVDTECFQPQADRAAARARWGVGAGEFLFLAVRRLDPRMGLDRLVEAFARVAPGFPRARLLIAGTGPMRGVLEASAARLLHGGRIRLLGRVPEADLPALYCAADCTVMPSLDLEGFGLATAESLACGTPVLGSRAGATPELLAPLDESLLFEPGSAGALADALRAALAFPEKLPARERCRAFALERFSWDGPADAFENCFKQLVRARSGGASI